MVTSFLGVDWLSTNEPSPFSREFKLETLRRMEAGENARELGSHARAPVCGVSGIVCAAARLCGIAVV